MDKPNELTPPPRDPSTPVPRPRGRKPSAATPGGRVRLLRQRAGLSLDELADLAQLGSPGARNGLTIGAWERGTGTSFHTAQCVAEALAKHLGKDRGEVLAEIAYGVQKVE